MASYTIPGGPFHPATLQHTVSMIWKTIDQSELTTSQRKYLYELARTRNAYWLGPDSEARQAQMERLVTPSYNESTFTFTYMTKEEASKLISKLAQMGWDSRVPRSEEINLDDDLCGAVIQGPETHGKRYQCSRPINHEGAHTGMTDRVGYNWITPPEPVKETKWATLETTSLQQPAVGTIVLNENGNPIGVVTGGQMTPKGMVVDFTLNDSGSSASLPWSQPVSSSDLNTAEQPGT